MEKLYSLKVWDLEGNLKLEATNQKDWVEAFCTLTRDWKGALKDIGSVEIEIEPFENKNNSKQVRDTNTEATEEVQED